MKIITAIDSLELNGGSTMFMEMICAFRKYHPKLNITPIVISKTGELGRQSLVHDSFATSYGIDDIQVTTYDQFESDKKSMCSRCDIFLHHRLSCTNPVYVDCPYVVVNHTVQSPKRIKNFIHADAIICVSRNIKKYTTKHTNHKDVHFILNGVENDYVNNLPHREFEEDFVSGACQRLVSSKIRVGTLRFISNIDIPKVDNYCHYFIGPKKNDNVVSAYKNMKVVDRVFDRKDKMAFIKAFDVYMYDARVKEGASMSMLEALACGVPVICRRRGGNIEIIRNNVNGFFFEDYDELEDIIRKLSKSKHMKNIRRTLSEDFAKRLHIKHMVDRYVDIFKRFK